MRFLRSLPCAARISFLMLSASFSVSAMAQAGQWTWMKGPQAPGGSGNYGTQGVPAASNQPPGCVNQFSWTSHYDGTFWIYGGQDNNGHGLAALWRYNPIGAVWTWMKGPTTFNFQGNFGVQGVEAATNLPPAKTFGGASWVDQDGNFWMYGGENGDNYLNDANNDLWRYDPTTNNWTWMKGSTADNAPGVWGTMGVPDINDQPPARDNCYGTWVDDQGDLWMFGGLILIEPVDDLWRYHIATNTWTWMNGSQTPNAPAIYGALGVEAQTNTPGARLTCSLGKDAQGMLWMQGGCLGTGAYGWGDVWRLNPSNGQWTWMTGSSAPTPAANCGTQCVPNATNDPGKRLTSPTWQTEDGRMWTFGLVANSGNPLLNHSRNDLWTFCPNTLTWNWVQGPSTNDDPGSWGALSVSSSTNRPNGRSMASTWAALNGDLYMFGGSALGAFSTYGDMWRYSPDPDCAICNTTQVVEEVSVDPSLVVLQNPVQDGMLSVRMPVGTWELEVFDMVGRSMYVLKQSCGKAVLDVGYLRNGIYLLVARGSSTAISAKFMVVH